MRRPRPAHPASPMATLDQARALALGLPGVAERDHHGRASFRVGGRIFATVWDPEHLNVMVDEPGIHTYRRPRRGDLFGGLVGQRLAAVRVRLDRVSERGGFGELLADAWEGKASRSPPAPRARILAAMAEMTLGEAAKAIGVSVDTLRRWDRLGRVHTDATSATAGSCPSRRSSDCASTRSVIARGTSSRRATAFPGASCRSRSTA